MLRDNKFYRLLLTLLTSGAAFIINCLINLLLTPYITRTVGTEAYGFVSLAKNVAQYAMIFTMALNSFSSRHIAVAYHKGDKDRANTFFSSTFFGDLALGTGIFAVVGVCIIFLDKLLVIPEAIVTDVKLLFLMVFINFWITTVFTAYSACAYVKNRLDIAGFFKGVSYLTEALILLILYRAFTARVSYVGVSLAAASAVIAASNIWMCRKYTPELRVSARHFSMGAVKRLVLDGIWASFNNLGELLNSGLDLLVCNLMLTALDMGQLAIAKTLLSIISGLLAMVGQSFEPMFLKSYSSGDKKVLLSELKFSMKVSGMFSNIVFAGIAALGLSFCRLWIPGEDVQKIHSLTVVTCLMMIPGGPMKPLHYIYTLTVKRKIPCLITIAGGFCNVAGMYLLIRYTDLGVYAVVWTTAVVMGVINFVTNPLYMAHVLDLPPGTFFPNILRNVVSAGILTFLFTGAARFYMPDSWPALFAMALCLAGTGALVHGLVVFDRLDWKRVASILKKNGRN